MLLSSKMETFLLKDNFNSSDSLSPPLLHGPIVTGLLALEYHESLRSLTFGVLSISWVELWTPEQGFYTVSASQWSVINSTTRSCFFHHFKRNYLIWAIWNLWYFSALEALLSISGDWAQQHLFNISGPSTVWFSDDCSLTSSPGLAKCFILTC